MIRLTSLSGIANRYIALTPAPELGQGARRRRDAAGRLDHRRRRPRPALQHARPGDAQGPAGRHPGLRDAVRRQGQAGRRVGRVLQPVPVDVAPARQPARPQDEATLTDFIVNSSRAVTAVAERRDDLAALVGNTQHDGGRDRARERRARRRRSALLPTTLRRANTTFVNLRSTLDDLDPLVAASKPATKDLAPFLRELRPLVPAREPTIHDLRLAASAQRRPTTTWSTRRASCPACSASPARPSRTRGRRCVKSQPVLEFIRPYAPELTGWFHDFGQGDLQLRRQRPLRAHPADLQRVLVQRQPGRWRARARRA